MKKVFFIIASIENISGRLPSSLEEGKEWVSAFYWTKNLFFSRLEVLHRLDNRQSEAFYMVCLVVYRHIFESRLHQ